MPPARLQSDKERTGRLDKICSQPHMEVLGNHKGQAMIHFTGLVFTLVMTTLVQAMPPLDGVPKVEPRPERPDAYYGILKNQKLRVSVSSTTGATVDFEGKCTVILPNKARKSFKFADDLEFSKTLQGHTFESCDIQNTSARGALDIEITEGSRTILKQRISAPKQTHLGYSKMH